MPETIRLTSSHSHNFSMDTTHQEKNTRTVVLLTAGMMTAEIIGGLVFGSMALLADGFHMGTHAFALGIALLAYRYARRNVNNPAFSFGTGKVTDLGGYTSAILLLTVAFLMAVESVKRFLTPVDIHFEEAILVAGIGLAVNLGSAWILRDHHDHDHDHSSQHVHNLKAAYLHVLADALTSVLAIAALVLGKFLGWNWMDPLMGIVGAIVITRWSIGLLKDTSSVLLDKTPDPDLAQQIKTDMEAVGNICVNDLHLWEVAPHQYAVILAVTATPPIPAHEVRTRLESFPQLVHITVEMCAAETVSGT